MKRTDYPDLGEKTDDQLDALMQRASADIGDFFSRWLADGPDEIPGEEKR